MNPDQALELQVFQCVKAISHKTAGQIYRELRTRFHDVDPSVLAGILDKIIKGEDK